MCILLILCDFCVFSMTVLFDEKLAESGSKSENEAQVNKTVETTSKYVTKNKNKTDEKSKLSVTGILI